MRDQPATPNHPGRTSFRSGCSDRTAARRDFDATVPHLTGAQRATLEELLARVHPGHAWLTDL
ncbi:hypothetical protein ACIBUR_25670 [Streptomyces anulatus]